MDFSRLLPGPFGTMVLGDLGADIISIEKPSGFDLMRSVGPKVDGVSGYHITLNRNKRQLELDLKVEKSREIIYQLIQTYDIIVESFRPGVMERFGLDYPSLKDINPDLIYCSITGYGQNSPKQDDAGHDINYLSLSGVASHSGSKQHGPSLAGVQIADLSGSFYLAIAILSAYIHRQNTGNGQYIDISMTDTVMSMQILKSVDFLIGGELPTFEDGMLNGGSFYDYYETSDGRYLSIGSLEPKFYRLLVSTLEEPKLHSLHPQKDVDQVKSIITDCIKSKPLEYWLDKFNDIDACVEPVLNFKEVSEHPHTRHRKSIDHMEIEDEISLDYVTHPVRYSDFDPTPSTSTTQRGKHIKSILKEIGLLDKLERFQSLGVFG